MQFILQPTTVIFELSFTRGNAVWELIRGNQYQNFLILIQSKFPLNFWEMTYFENFPLWLLRISSTKFCWSFPLRFSEFLKLSVLFHSLLIECDKAEFLVSAPPLEEFSLLREILGNSSSGAKALVSHLILTHLCG